MKKQLVILLAMILGATAFQSCNKKERKALKDIEGTWTITGATFNGTPDEREIVGTYIFEDCKYRLNKKQNCDCLQDVTITYQGVSEQTQNTLKYRVDDKGETLLVDDVNYHLDLNGEVMTWTYNDGTNTQIINLTKQ